MRTIEDILERGIPKEGTRNQIQLRIIRHFAYQGLNETQVKARIMDWYHRRDHNSKDWRDRPKYVERELEAAIKNWFGKMRVPGALPRTGLSLRDVKNILRISNPCKQYGRFGNKAYSTQRFLFSLLAYYKAIGRDTAALPYNKTIVMDGVSRKTEVQRIKFAQECGLLFLVRKHDRFAHQARVFRLNYTFADGTQVDTLQDGIRWLYSRSEIFRLFSRDIYQGICNGAERCTINKVIANQNGPGKVSLVGEASLS